MCPEELVAAITAVAIAIANCSTDEELPVLASAFNQLGDTIATIGAQRDRLKNCLEKNI